MKSKIFRLVAVCLVAILTLTLFVQNPVFAKEADEGLSRLWKPKKVLPSKPSTETLVPSVANPEGSQPRSGEDGREFRLREKKGTESQRDRDRREIVKEVTGERHTPGGGPQEQ